MKTINISIPSPGPHIYSVSFCRDAREIADGIARRHPGAVVFIVSDRRVFPLYGKRLAMELSRAGATVRTIVLPAGEAQKSRRSKARLDDSLLRGGIARDSILIALGGGVIGDLAGYSAATILRGVRLVQVPTTLLAQVDSSVGGKVGINHPLGKNLVGAFHQPDAVYIAPSTLRTLSLTDYLSGIGEIIKYGMILDRDLFGLLEKRAGKILARRRDELGTIISRCIRLKASVVSADERESGIRRILNYGHTAGHAVEILTAYRVPHGHAVAVGMIVEAAISRELGLLSPGDFERLRKLVTRYGLPARLPAGLSPARILRAISRDKKKISGSVRFTLVKKIGEGITGVSVPEDVLKKVLAR